MNIEFNTSNGENILLAPYQIYDEISNDKIYNLLDANGISWMKVKLENSSFSVIEKSQQITDDDDLIQVKLNKIAFEVIEMEQNGSGFTESIEVIDISPYDPERIKIHSKAFNLRLISDMIDDGDIDLAPDFQRNYVWNSHQKSRLIESILLRIPLPMFYFSEDEEGRITVVDGLQRLTTIKQFMENEFQLKGLEYLQTTCEGKYYSSIHKNGEPNGLPSIEGKYFRWFNQTQFSVNVIDPTSPQKVKYDIFRRINTGGKPLNNQEIRNCLAGKGLRDTLKQMVSLPEFLSATDHSIKPTRMDDQEVALRFILFYGLSGDDNRIENYTGYMDSELDNLTDDLSKYSFEELQHHIGHFSNAMKNAEYLFGSRHAFRKVVKKDIAPGANKQLINKALFVSCSVLLSKIDHESVRSMVDRNLLLEPLATNIEENRTFFNYLSYGTNSKANLIYVFTKINELISTHLAI
ncbi:MAG: hypothetical protein K0S26_2994 [Bacteroidota bacterium]|jgi:hypothetical protein|nr:hypothetical protein [Bacteroidota bacterium]